MLVRHVDRKLERLETDLHYTAGFDRALVKAYRKRMQMIRQALDEREFFAFKSLHYEKLKGNRRHQRSMRLNDQFRLIVQVEEVNGKTVVVIEIADYH